MDFFDIATPIISAATLTVLGMIGNALKRAVAEIRDDFEAMKRSQRNQIKSEITRTYHIAKEHGYITESELQAALSLYEDYKALGGNSFIPSIIERIKQMDIVPDDYRKGA